MSDMWNHEDFELELRCGRMVKREGMLHAVPGKGFLLLGREGMELYADWIPADTSSCCLSEEDSNTNFDISECGLGNLSLRRVSLSSKSPNLA